MIKGYKVFSPDWTCRGFQYEVGKTYEEDVTPNICERGFHFCKQASDCFNYYNFNSKNKVAEVIAIGAIDEGDDKCCTNKIEIVREIPWQEVLTIVNIGKENSGLRNTGNCNTGDWNISDHETGIFCTEEHKIKIFDTESDMTFDQWRNSEAYRLLCRIEFCPTTWVYDGDMTDEEEKNHPEYETTGGYLRQNDMDNAFFDWWKSLTQDEKKVIKNIPNFNAEKFMQITGIDVSVDS